MTILTDTLGDNRTFVNDLTGQVVVHKDFNFTMTDEKAVYSRSPGYDNKLPVDIEGNRLLLVLERPGDQIILDQTNRPVIGIGSRIRFDLHNWVPFLDGRYRGGGVTIAEKGLIPEVGTQRLESGAISEFDGKTWVDSQAEKEPARSEPSPAPKTSPESLGWSVTVQSMKKSRILHADLPGTRMLYSAATWGFDEFLVVALNVRKLPMGQPFEVKSEGTYLTGDQGAIFKMKGRVDNAGNYNPFVESHTCDSSETLTLVFGITGTSEGYVLQLTEGLPPIDLPEAQAEIK